MASEYLELQVFSGDQISFVGLRTCCRMCLRWHAICLESWYPVYPLVMTNIAIEHGHRNSEFSHSRWWFSIVFCMFTRGYICPRICKWKSGPLKSTFFHFRVDKKLTAWMVPDGLVNGFRSCRWTNHDGSMEQTFFGERSERFKSWNSDLLMFFSNDSILLHQF